MDKDLETFRIELADNPDDAEALGRLESALLRAGDWEGLVALTDERAERQSAEDAHASYLRVVALLEQAAEVIQDNEPLSWLLLVLGRAQERWLGAANEAMLHYQQAFQLHSQNTDALRAARAIYVDRKQWELVVQLLDLEAQYVFDPIVLADLRLEAAEIISNLMERPTDSIPYIREALRLVPDHPAAAPFLSLVAEAQQEEMARYNELKATADSTRDLRQRAAYLVEAGDLLLRISPADERIISIAKDAAEADPRCEGARVLHEAFLQINERWDELTSLLLSRAEATARKGDRLAIFQRLAEIAVLAMKDNEKAVEWHREVLKLEPGETASLDFCVEFFYENERWVDLVEIYEAALRTRSRAGSEGAMLTQIAMILWKKVGDLEAAEGYFKRIKLNDPRNGLMLQFYSDYYNSKEDWKRLLGTLASRQANEESIEGRISVGLEMAEVAETKLDNLAKAIDIWKAILKLDPLHVGARTSLRRLFYKTAKWNALLEFLKEDIGLIAVSDVQELVSIYEQMIAIYRDELHLPVMVINTYNQILQADPSNERALSALQETYEVGARWNDLIGILRRRAEVAAEKADLGAQVDLFRRIAGLWLERFSNQNNAIQYFENILELSSTDRDAITQLIEIHRGRKDWKALYGIYSRELAILSGSARLERLQEMAKIASGRLDLKDESIAHWREVLSLDPTSDAAWQALEGLYARCERFADLAELYAARAEADQANRAAWLKKLAMIQADKLADEDRAAITWRAVLELSPGDFHAEGFLRELYLRRRSWDALEGLYASRSDYEGIVRLLGAEAEGVEEVALKVELFSRMARVCLENLENEAAAVECWERILAEDPDNLEAARALAPRYELAEAWEALVAVLEVVLRNGAEDPVALMVGLAQIQEEKLGDLAQAYRWYAEALAHAPFSAELLDEARRTARAAGLQEALVELLETLIDLVETEGEEEEARFRRVLGETCADELGRSADAVIHFERLRVLLGDEPEVLGALEEAYRKLARFDNLLEVLSTRLDQAETARERIRLLGALGELHESIREDAAAARLAYEQLRALEPSSLEALHGLQRLAEASGDMRALAEYVRAELDLTEAPAAVAALLFRLGQLADRRGAPEEAVGLFGQVLDREVGHLGALSALEAFLDGALGAEAARILEPHMRRAGAWSSLRRVLELQVEDSSETAFRARLLREVAELREARLSDPRGAFETYRRLLVETRTDEGVRLELERLASDLGLFEALAELYGRLGIGGDLADDDAATCAAYSRRLAAVQEERLGLLSEARETLLALMADQGDDLVILDSVDRLCVRLEDWNGLVKICERRLPLLQSTNARIEVLFRVGDLWEELLDSPVEAAEVYRRIRLEDRKNPRAIASLERIFRQIEQFDNLAELLEDRLDGAGEDEQVALGYQLAQVLEHALHRVDDALTRYADVLAIEASHEPTLEALESILIERDADSERGLRARACEILEPVYKARGDWNSRIHLLQVQLSDAEDVSARVDLRARIAALYEIEGGELFSALASFGAAFEDDYGNREVLAELLRLADEAGAYAELAAIFRTGLDDENKAAFLEPALRREMLGRVAALYEERVDDAAQAVAFNLRILEDDAEDLIALASLDRLYQKLGQVQPLVDVLERRVNLEQDSELRAALSFRLGELYEEQLEQPERAVMAFSRIRQEINSNELRAHEALERLHATSGDFEALVEVLLDHAERLEAVEEQKSLFFRAAATYEDGLERPEEAVTVYRRLLEIAPEDRQTLAQLDRLFGQLERAADLLDVLEREAELTTADDERDEFEYRMGALLVSPLMELPRALAHFEAVLGRNPGHIATREALELLLEEPEVRLEAARLLIPRYEADGAWQSLRATLRGTLQDLDGLEERVITLRRIASIEEDKLAAQSAAFDSLAEAYGLGEGDLAIEAELERLVEPLARHADLANLFGQVVLQAPARAIDLYLKVASLAELNLGDLPRAIENHQRVLALEPDDLRALNALERLFERIQDHRALVGVLEQKAELASEFADKRPLWVRMAVLQEELLEEPTAAVETWRRLLAEDEKDQAALDNLERLLEAGERWSEVASLCEHRVGITEAPEERAAVQYRLARVCERWLSEGERALELYRQVLEVIPDHGPTLAALAGLFEDLERAEACGADRLVVATILEPHYRKTQESGALVEVLEVRQDALVDEPESRIALLREMAGLREYALCDAPAAFETCARVLSIAPEHQENRKDLHRLGDATRAVERLAACLDDAASQTSEPELKVTLLLELAKVEESRRGGDERARDVLREVLSIEPANEQAVASLVELFSRIAAWEDLVQLYSDLAESSSEVAVQKELYFKVAQLFEDVVDDVERAVATYRRVLEIEPENFQAFTALERFFTKGARFGELASLLRERIQCTETPADRARLRNQLAEVQEARLSDLDGAIETWRIILDEDDEEDAAAQEALERLLIELADQDELEPRRRVLAEILEPLYAKRGHWSPWITVMEVQLAFQQDPYSRLEFLTRIAQVHEAELSSPEAAFEAYGRAFAVDYGNTELRKELDRLASQLGAWQPLVDIYLAGIAEYTDVDGAVAILTKVAETFDAELGESERAIECYARVLELDDGNATAQDALERLFTSEKRHEDLIQILSKKVDQSSNPLERKGLLYRICELWEVVLDRPSEAIDSYRQVFEEDGSDQRAVEALIRLYTRTEQWPLLIEALREKLDAQTENAKRKEVLYRIAKTYEEQLSDPDETIQSHRAVLELDAQDRVSLDALERLYRQERRWAELIDLLEGEREACAEDVKRIDELELQIAQVLQAELGQVERAIESYGEILGRSPSAVAPRSALEGLLEEAAYRLLAAKVLEGYYESQQDAPALVRILSLELEDLSERAERLDLFKRLSELYRGPLGDLRRAYQTLAQAFSEDPTAPEVVDQLQGMAESLGLYAEYAELLNAHVGEVMDDEIARDLNRRLGRLYDRELRLFAPAVEAWQAVLRGDPYDREGLEALDRLYQAAQDWSALIDVLRRRIDAGEGDDLDLRFRLGYLLEVVEGDLVAAIELYRGILLDKPDHGYSLEAMERLAVNLDHRQAIAEVLEPIYRDALQWGKLAILTEMRVELYDSALTRAELWLEIASLRLGQLDDASGSMEALLQALGETPEHEEVREQLDKLAERLGAWDVLVDAYEAVLARLTDADLAVADHLRLAEWSDGHLHDRARAINHYQAALAISPENERALSALEKLFTDAQAWAELADVYRAQVAAIFDLEEKRARLHLLGALCAEKLSDRAQAVAAYEQALELDETDALALAALERLHEQAADWTALVGILERQVESTYEGEALVQIHRRMGALYRDKLGDLIHAAESYEKVLVLEPEDDVALPALEALYTTTESWEQLQEVLVKRLSACSDDQTRRGILFMLGHNAETKLQRGENAIEYYRQILAQSPDDREAMEALAHLYEAASRYFDLVETLKDHLEATRGGDKTREIDLLVRIARIAEAHLGDADLAIETLNEVLALDPNQVGALEVLARLHERSGEWEKAAERLEQALSHVGTLQETASVQRRLGFLYLEHLERPDDAQALLELAVEATGDEEALAGLLTLARAKDDQAKIVALLERRLVKASGKTKVEILLEIAQIRKKSGDLSGTISALEGAFEASQQELAIGDRLLEAYFDANRAGDAEPLLKKIVEKLKEARRVKDLFKYTYQLGRVAEARGDDDAALAAYTACFEQDATFVPNLCQLGKLHFRRQDWEKALKVFQTALLHQTKLDNEGRVDVFYHLGVVRLELGDKAKAKDMFDRALKLVPDHEPTKRAKERL